MLLQIAIVSETRKQQTPKPPP